MSPIHTWGLLGVWAALAVTPARSAEPDGPPPAVCSALKPMPGCPHCRKASLLAQQAAASDLGTVAPAPPSSPSASAEAAAIAQEPATLDVDVRQVQVPSVLEAPRPSVPDQPATNPGPATGPRARLLPPPAPNPNPSTGPDAAGGPGPRARIVPPPSAAAATTAAAAPAPPPEAPTASDEAFARAPGGDMAGQGDGSGASGIGFNYAPIMLGDQAPPSLHEMLITGRPPSPQPPSPGQPPTPPSPFPRGGGGSGGQVRTNAFVPWARGFKVADNQSPAPQDRVFYTFDYFNDLNGDVNRRAGSGITDQQAYRELLGIEKTFLQGNASIGVRLPINTLFTNSLNPALRNTSTAVGNMTFFSKYVLWKDPAAGNLLSGGLAFTTPNGPSSFAGSPSARGFHDAQIQPFLGYILRRGDLFLQGFTAIDVPTDPHDVTMWYNDAALGYFAYRATDPSAFLSAVIPTFEVHLSDPLNHRGAFRPNDPAGTPDVLDLTFGSSFVLRKRMIASFCACLPVTGPRPFDVEVAALLNIYYGRYGMGQASSPPPIGQ